MAAILDAMPELEEQVLFDLTSDGVRSDFGRDAGQIADDVLATIGVKREELADKLRQPLGELVADKKIHTVGEKRLMKYHAGAKK